MRRIDNRACDAAACEEETVKVMVKHDTCKTKGTLKVFKKVYEYKVFIQMVGHISCQQKPIIRNLAAG